MVDFKKMMSPEAIDRLNRHNKLVAEFREMSADKFIDQANNYLNNSRPPLYGDGTQMLKGAPVYDATLYYVIVPEMIRRLEFSAREWRESIKNTEQKRDDAARLQESTERRAEIAEEAISKVRNSLAKHRAIWMEASKKPEPEEHRKISRATTVLMLLDAIESLICDKR